MSDETPADVERAWDEIHAVREKRTGNDPHQVRKVDALYAIIKHTNNENCEVLAAILEEVARLEEGGTNPITVGEGVYDHLIQAAARHIREAIYITPGVAT